MKAILVWATLFLICACGEHRPVPYFSRDTDTTDKRSEPIPATQVPDTNSDNAQPFNGRTRATAPELTAARELYDTECSICHSPFDRSTKRAVTLTRLTGAGVPMAVPLHMDLIRALKWPMDQKDVKDDGIDSARLGASALVEVLK